MSLSIRPGECLGFVGPNGAGKSTLVKILTGLLKPSGGDLSVLACRPSDRRTAMLSALGVVFGHKTSMWWDLPVRHSFDAVRRIYRVPETAFGAQVEHLAGTLHLHHLMDRPVRQLSLGERVKCELALALSHRPRVLLLDEPTIGVDLESKHQLRNLIRSESSDRQLAVFLTSHDVNDILSCCSHIELVHAGRVFESGSLDDILDRLRVRRENTRDFEEKLIGRFRDQRRTESEIVEFGPGSEESPVENRD